MRRGRILLIVGLILVALTVAGGGFLLWQRMGGPAAPTPPPVEEGESVPYAPPEGKQILVAAQDIPRGTLITADSGAVVTASWPQDSAAAEMALAEPDAASGRIARVDIVRGSPILEKMLAEGPEGLGATGSDAALRIPTGRVAYSLPVDRYSSVAWALQPGDHVDLLISMLLVDLDEEFQTILPNQAACVSPTEEEGCQSGVLGRLESLPNGWVVNVRPSEGQRPGLVTQLTVQDMVVLRIGDWRERKQPPPEEADVTPTPAPDVEPMTVAVTPQDAAVIKYAEEAGANMTLVLRSVGDASKAMDTEPVTLEYLFERYDIERPPKLPYGMEPPLKSLRSGTTGGSESGSQETLQRD